jgi:hypothetical protein
LHQIFLQVSTEEKYINQHCKEFFKTGTNKFIYIIVELETTSNRENSEKPYE